MGRGEGELSFLRAQDTTSTNEQAKSIHMIKLELRGNYISFWIARKYCLRSNLISSATLSRTVLCAVELLSLSHCHILVFLT